jgi:ribosomal protein S18 acetylase RimI-like enzyme|tara:strand:+ start:54 stop:587 length:534 start_codon:yes stop_codon:yes gene_type:complete
MPDENTPKADPVSVIPMGADFTIRATEDKDQPWIRRLLRRYWATEKILSKGKIHDAVTCSGLAAFRDDEPVGLILYNIDGEDCEIVTHNSLADSGGIGSCLLAALRNEARAHGCKRLWLVTTNDNTPAVRFYQRRDFDICAFHKDAISKARELKPEIPDEGLDGIRVRHEIELEYVL